MSLQTAQARPWGEGRKRLHRRRQLTPKERLRICEEYLAGHDRAMLIDRWGLYDERALGDLVRRVFAETTRKIRRQARVAKMMGRS